MNFKLYRSLQGLEEIEGAWWNMLAMNPSAQFHQSPQWYKAYITALAESDTKAVFVAAYLNEELCFVWPLMQRTIPVFGIEFNVLSSPSHNHLSLVDGLCTEQALSPDTALSLIQFLKEQGVVQWDWIYVKKALQQASIHRLLNSSSRQIDFEYNRGNSYFIDCSQDIDTTLQHLSAKYKRNLRRQKRKAEQMGEITFKVLEGESLVEYFDEFLSLEGSGWKGETGTAIILHRDLIKFYRSLIQYQNNHSRCVLNALFLNDELIAAQFAIVNATTMNLLKIAYNENMSKVAPGSILLNHVIQYCVDQNDIKELCFVTAPSWASVWKSGSWDVYSYLIFNHNVKGLLAKAYTSIKYFAQSIWRLKYKG